MKEDILEQLVEEYLQQKGYFTMHNIRFRPSDSDAEWDSKTDSVRSDIDIVGYNPCAVPAERVWVVSCKAWQSGFNAQGKLRALRASIDPEQPKRKKGREAWKYYRELAKPKWSLAFRTKLKELTGQDEFHYFIAVTKLVGDGAAWAADPTVIKNLDGNAFDFLTLGEMWKDVFSKVERTPASTNIGRLAQLLKAAGLSVAAAPPDAPKKASAAPSRSSS
jgi:hypothetical protein